MLLNVCAKNFLWDSMELNNLGLWKMSASKWNCSEGHQEGLHRKENIYSSYREGYRTFRKLVLPNTDEMYWNSSVAFTYIRTHVMLLAFTCKASEMYSCMHASRFSHVQLKNKRLFNSSRIWKQTRCFAVTLCRHEVRWAAAAAKSLQ